jgi:hypothetical protein
MRHSSDSCSTYTSAGLRERIPLLRVLDVAVWMRNRQASDCPLRYTRCAHWT